MNKLALSSVLMLRTGGRKINIFTGCLNNKKKYEDRHGFKDMNKEENFLIDLVTFILHRITAS